MKGASQVVMAFPQRGDLVHKPSTGAYGYLTGIDGPDSKIAARVQMYSRNRSSFTSSKLRWSGGTSDTLAEWVHTASDRALEKALMKGLGYEEPAKVPLLIKNHPIGILVHDADSLTWVIEAVSEDVRRPWVILRRGKEYQRLELEAIAQVCVNTDGKSLIEHLAAGLASSEDYSTLGALMGTQDGYAVVTSTQERKLYWLGRDQQEPVSDQLEPAPDTSVMTLPAPPKPRFRWMLRSPVVLVPTGGVLTTVVASASMGILPGLVTGAAGTVALIATSEVADYWKSRQHRTQKVVSASAAPAVPTSAADQMQQALKTTVPLSNPAQQIVDQLRKVGVQLLSVQGGGIDRAQAELLLLDHVPMALRLHAQAHTQVDEEMMAAIDAKLVHQLGLIATEVQSMQNRMRQQVLDSQDQFGRFLDGKLGRSALD